MIFNKNEKKGFEFQKPRPEFSITSKKKVLHMFFCVNAYENIRECIYIRTICIDDLMQEFWSRFLEILGSRKQFFSLYEYYQYFFFSLYLLFFNYRKKKLV